MVRFLCLGVFLFASHAHAQGISFFNLNYNPGFGLVNQGSAALDLTRDDSPEYLSPGFLGLNTLMSVDEDGRHLKDKIFSWWGAPAYPAGSLPLPMGLASGKLDPDDYDDLVWVSSGGSVHILYNNGSHSLNVPFRNATMIDNFGPTYTTVNPPFSTFRLGAVRVFDIDQDGKNDIIVGVAPIDTWNGRTLPGELIVYHNLGSGSFSRDSLPISGNLIDVKWVDIDGNGAPDHLVYVTETGGLGAFGYDIHHATWAPGNFVDSIYAQSVLGRVTSFEVTDVNGDGAPDYVFPTVTLSHPLSSAVYWYGGDRQSHVIQNVWGTLGMPGNSTGLGDHVLSIQKSDFDGDGREDLVLIRGYSSPPTTSNGSAVFASSEIFAFVGPLNPWTSPSSQSLGGYTVDAWSADRGWGMIPHWGTPETLKPLTLGKNNVQSLLIGSVVRNGSSAVLSIKNVTPTAPGEPALERVGEPTGGSPNQKPRLGFEGDPVVGNANFAATVSNVAGGTLVGLAWSSWAQPNFLAIPGTPIIVNTVGEVFANLGYASGTPTQEGFFRQAIPIPNVATMAIDSGFFEARTYDFATGRIGSTQATHLYIGH